MRFGRAAIALLLMLCMPSLSSVVHAEAKEREPFDSSIVERSGVSLMLLDVVVTDEKGEPLPGLSAEDFTVQLNGKLQDLYSLDDLCSVEPTESRPAEGTVAIAPSAATRFILYFDFSQLQSPGRDMAVNEARRWIRERMGPNDEVSIVAFATQPGLRQLIGFTKDRQAALNAIQEVNESPEFVDSFPTLFSNRITECTGCCSSRTDCGDCLTCCPVCVDNARREREHGQRAVRALKRYVAGLELHPGRKHLIYFHENAVLHPARFYPPGAETRVGDLVSVLDQLGAEGTLSNTAIHSAFSGNPLLEPEGARELPGQAINFGANLADYTGGTYSRGVDLPAMLDQAGTNEECLYRIGIRRPQDVGDKIFRALVRVNGRKLKHRYRVHFLDEVDRWWRRARAVLSRPEEATDIPIVASLHPVKRTKKGWQVAVKVLLDAESLMLIPTANTVEGEWEVGALLSRNGGQKNWEMLGKSRVRVTGPGDSEKLVLHERHYTGLRQGSYRFAAFVRDRAGGVFGAGELVLDLPDSRKGGVIGPVAFRAGKEHISSSLPLLTERAEGGERGKIALGDLPLGAFAVPHGESLKFVTWICLATAEETGQALQPLRYVSRADEPVLRLDQPKFRGAGECARLTDVVKTRPLGVGSYVYHLRGLEADSEGSIERTVPFEVTSEE